MTTKAMIFDDDDLMLQLLSAFLSANDIAVSASNCATCKMYEQNATSCPLIQPKFNIILSDNDMPGKNGIDFFEEIEAKDCKLSNKCKALMSGQFTQQTLNRAEKLGIKTFLKPFSFEALGKWLDNAICYSQNNSLHYPSH